MSMKSAISAEVIHKLPRPWLAKIVAVCDVYGFEREFLKPVPDYSHGQHHHTRGVYWYWFVDDGVYQLDKPISWKHRERVFLRACGGEVAEITKDEVMECLQK